MPEPEDDKIQSAFFFLSKRTNTRLSFSRKREPEAPPTLMEPKAKLRLRSKGSELGPGAADRREGPAAVGDLSAAATAASMRRFEA